MSGKRINFQREIPKAKFLAAFSLTAFIFLLIIFTNNYLNQIRMNNLNSMYDEIRLDTLNAETQYQIISENPCKSLNFNPLSDELFDLGQRLTEMETDLGKKNQQVLDLKKYYSIIEIRQYLFVKKLSTECAKNATPIIYFYSNEQDCGNCESQGFVLNYVRNSVPGTYIYSFDVNLDSSAVKALKASYNVTSVPSLVIKDETYTGFKNSDEVIKIIKEE